MVFSVEIVVVGGPVWVAVTETCVVGALVIVLVNVVVVGVEVTILATTFSQLEVGTLISLPSGKDIERYSNGRVYVRSTEAFRIPVVAREPHSIAGFKS